jgi:hypothetical protein
VDVPDAEKIAVSFDSELSEGAIQTPEPNGPL